MGNPQVRAAKRSVRDKEQGYQYFPKPFPILDNIGIWQVTMHGTEAQIGLPTVPYTAMAIHNTVYIWLLSVPPPVLYASISETPMVWYVMQDGHKMVVWVDMVK